MIFHAYTHNGDRELLRSLGLKTSATGAGSWVELGTTIVHEAKTIETGRPKRTVDYPACTVTVEVAAYPAQFWRFTVSRYDEEIVEEDGDDWGVRLTEQRFVLRTGSGGFWRYWPVAEMVAQNLLDVEVAECSTV